MRATMQRETHFGVERRAMGRSPLVARVLILTGLMLASVLAGLWTPSTSPTKAQGHESSCVTSSQRSLQPSHIALGEALTITLRLQASCPDSATPFHVVFVVDASGSMAGHRLDETRAALEDAVARLDLPDHPETRVGVVAFDDGSRTLCELTNDRARVNACLDALEASGGSAIDLGVLEGLMVLRAGRQLAQSQIINEIMIVLSDGANSSGCQAVLQAAQQVKSQGILLISACIGDSCDAACLREVASSARYFYPELDDDAIASKLLEIRGQVTGIRQLAVTDRLPPNMRYLADSANPPASFEASTNELSWRQNFIPADGITYSFQIEPLEIGTHPTSLEARADFRDGQNGIGSTTFPIEDVVVSRGAPTPTPDPVPELVGRLGLDSHHLALGERAMGEYTLDFELPEPAGDTHLALVLDQSGSMAGQSMNLLQQGVRMMFDRLEPVVTPERFAASVVAFSNVTKLLCSLTDDFGQLRGCVGVLNAAGGTAIDIGIDAGLDSLRAGRPWDGGEDLVIFSDGANNRGCDAVQAAADRAKSEGVVVHGVCLGDACDEACMRSAASSPRHYFKVDDAGNLPATFGGIAEDLLARRGVETVDLELSVPEHLALVPEGFSIEPDEQGERMASWSLPRMPAGGLALQFEVEALGPGDAIVEMGATIHRLDEQPLRDERVSEPVEVPGTPTQATPTPPDPGETPTPTEEDRPTYETPDGGTIYLPLLLHEACPGGSSSDLVLVFDSSLSMAERFGSHGSKLDAAREGAAALVARLGAEDRIALVAFDAEARTLQDFTRDADSLRAALAEIELARGTAIDAGIDRATELLLASPREAMAEGVIVLISNGRALESDPEAAVAAADRARGYKLKIRAVGLGREVDEPTLRAIAGSEEDYRRVEEAGEARRALDRLGRDLECSLESLWGRR